MNRQARDPRTDPRVAVGLDAQLRVFRELRALGLGRLGWKVGLNDPAIQKRLELGGPVVGHMTADGLLPAGRPVELDPAGAYAIEAEIAVHMGSGLSAGASDERASEAIDSVSLGVELVNYARGAGDLEGMIAHNLFHTGLALGEVRTAADRLKLPDLEAWIDLDGERHTVDPVLVPRDLSSVARLVADLVEPHGEALCAGDWILSGSVVQPVRVRPGNRAVVAIAGLDSIDMSFEAPG